MSNGKVMIIILITKSIKKHCIKMSQYLAKKYRSFWENAKVELDLSSYAIKITIKRSNRNWFF